MKSTVAKENPGSPAASTLVMAVKKNGLKNKWLRAQAALVIGFVLQAGLAAAQTNLVTNPGFETGDTTGWFAWGSCTLSVETNQVHSGTYACLVTNRTQTYMGIAQSFLGVLQAGQTYNVSAWLRLASGTNQTMQLTMQKIDGSGTNYTAMASGSVSTNGWTQLSGQYKFNPSGTVSSLTWYAEVPSSATAAYFIDDVSVSIVPTNGQCTVDWTNVAQRIDGFGASSAWGGSWTTNQANMFFGTNNGTGTSLDGTTNFAFAGIGLSLLRNHIAYANTTSASDTPTTVETNIMLMAQARGARVWSTPWTPPAGFKSVNDIYDSGVATDSGIDGGSYLGSGNNITNVNYASQLANYVVSMKNQGINLYAISVQNEPDASVTNYEACQWTGTQIHDFVTNLYAALVAKGVGSTKIMVPEDEFWETNLYFAAMSDSSVATNVAIVANHSYYNLGYPAAPLPLYSNTNAALWETEVSTGDAYDGSINNGVSWATRIYQFLTVAQANAWHYWWLIPENPPTWDNEALTDTNGIPAKRMYALGQFARFVRPGYYRINVPTNTSSAQVSAYKNPNSGNFAIVAINSSLVVVTQAFNFTNVTGISSVTPWITSATMSLSNQTPVGVSGSSFSYALPALSVVTFVGQSVGATSSNIVVSGTAYLPSGSGFVLTWNATAGAYYSMLKTNVLSGSSTNWPAIVTGYPTGGASGGPLSYTDTTATVSPAFYRVRSP